MTCSETADMGRLGTGMPSSPRSRCYCAPHAPESRESDCMHTVLMHAAPALRHSRASRICGERGVGDALDGFCRLGVVYLVGSDSADPGSRKLVRGVALPGLKLTHSTAPRKRPARSRGKTGPAGVWGVPHTPHLSGAACISSRKAKLGHVTPPKRHWRAHTRSCPFPGTQRRRARSVSRL